LQLFPLDINIPAGNKNKQKSARLQWLTPVILAQTNSSNDPISKITRGKWTGGMAQAVEHLLRKLKTKFEPQHHRKKKIKERKKRKTEIQHDAVIGLVNIQHSTF
jgi:hypothetical protein